MGYKLESFEALCEGFEAAVTAYKGVNRNTINPSRQFGVDYIRLLIAELKTRTDPGMRKRILYGLQFIFLETAAPHTLISKEPWVYNGGTYVTRGSEFAPKLMSHSLKLTEDNYPDLDLVATLTREATNFLNKLMLVKDEDGETKVNRQRAGKLNPNDIIAFSDTGTELITLADKKRLKSAHANTQKEIAEEAKAAGSSWSLPSFLGGGSSKSKKHSKVSSDEECSSSSESEDDETDDSQESPSGTRAKV